MSEREGTGDGEEKQSRYDTYMDQFPKTNAIIMFCKHILIKILHFLCVMKQFQTDRK